MRSFFRSALLASVLLLPACEKPTTYAPYATPEEIQAEQALQQQMVDEVAAKGGTHRNWRRNKDMSKRFEQVASRIEDAGAHVCREIGIPQQGRPCFYFFKVESGEELNAYADGKQVVVYSGMLHFMQNDEELATVLAHELAHNLMGHPEATQTNAVAGSLIGIALDAAAGSQGYGTGGRFSQMGANMGVLSYSAPFELEADYVGMYIMARAGFDIAKAPMLWRRMSIENPQGIYNRTTHPTNAERFVALNKTIKEITSKRKIGMEMVPEQQPVPVN